MANYKVLLLSFEEMRQKNNYFPKIYLLFDFDLYKTIKCKLICNNRGISCCLGRVGVGIGRREESQRGFWSL